MHERPFGASEESVGQLFTRDHRGIATHNFLLLEYASDP
jgi:hypothetical protein